jgi:hypothetical protein|tara:strand:- start:430 stop:636 length:207 start_codon:yes stop_codon:yes gene_type:complete
MYITIIDYAVCDVTIHELTAQEEESISNNDFRDNSHLVKKLGIDPSECQWIIHHTINTSDNLTINKLY